MKKGLVPPVKIFVAVIYKDHGIIPVLKQELTECLDLGAVDMPSAPFPFDLTDYYTPEMGRPLYRIFLPFERLATAGAAIPVKQTCLRLEHAFAREGKRTVNLDPGYLDLHKLVLISEKFLGHKIDIGHGMCADLTLLLGRKQVTPFPWTFPDFRSDRYHAYLLALRDRFRTQRQTWAGPSR